jgi:hypothetical protein
VEAFIVLYFGGEEVPLVASVSISVGEDASEVGGLLSSSKSLSLRVTCMLATVSDTELDLSFSVSLLVESVSPPAR